MCPPYGVVFSSKGCLILCELSSPPPWRTSTAIMWAQCSLPDSNRDPVSSVFRAGPVSHSCDLAIETCRSYGGPWLAKGLRHGGQALPECWPECTPHDCTAFVGPVHCQICQASNSPALGGTDPSAATGTQQGSSEWSKLWNSWCVTCSILVPNCDDVSSAFLAGPQPRSCELSAHCTQLGCWIVPCMKTIMMQARSCHLSLFSLSSDFADAWIRRRRERWAVAKAGTWNKFRFRSIVARDLCVACGFVGYSEAGGWQWNLKKARSGRKIGWGKLVLEQLKHT